MFPVAFRYIARNVAYTTLLTLAAFLALFTFFGVLDELDRVGRGTYTLQKMLLFVMLQIPGQIAELAPVATLIGGIVALAALAAGSEITVLRAGGLSTAKLGLWIVVMSVPFAIGIFVFSDFLTPLAERRATTLKLQALGGSVAAELASGSWVKDSNGDGQHARYVNAAQLLPNGRLAGVRLYEFDSAMRLSRTVFAAQGQAVPGGWELLKATETIYTPKPGPLGETMEARVSTADVWRWQTEVSPGVFGAVARTPDQMSALELYRTTQFLQSNQQRTDNLQLALYKKLVMPLSIAVMLLLALPFAFLHTRAGGVSAKMFAGIMLGILFFMVDRLFSHLGVLNTWPPAATALAPSLLGLAIAGSMLWWAQRVR